MKNRKWKEKRGFTLVELIVILLIPSLTGYRQSFLS